LHTFDLFHALVGLRDPLIIHSLVLRNLLPPQLLQQQLQLQQEAAAAAADSTEGAAVNPSATSLTSSIGGDIVPIPPAVLFANFNDPPDLLSGSAASQLDEYLLDAQLEAQLWMQAWESAEAAPATASGSIAAAAAAAVASSAASPSTSSASSPSSSPPPPFFEGLFLSTLLNKLESLYDNSFATNLRLTAVLAKLAYCPAPALHHFLFHAELTLPPGHPAALTSTATDGTAEGAGAEGSSDAPRTLLSVLQSLWNKGVKRSARMPHFARRKEEARQRLNQQLAASMAEQATNNGGGSNTVAQATVDGEPFLRGVIVLEEFLKELYAISCSKARLLALRELARLPATGAAGITSPRGIVGANVGATSPAAAAAASSPAAATPRSSRVAEAPQPPPEHDVDWPVHTEADGDSLP
jgi:hypothetical protein